MRNGPRNPVLVGTISAIVMLVVFTFIFVSGAPGAPTLNLPWSSQMTVKAELTSADNLQQKASVEIAGIKVGEVKDVQSSGDKALVTMVVEGRYADIHKDAHVLLRPHGLFGPKYIDLQPGSAQSPKLTGDDVIPSTSSAQPVDLDQVLQELQAPEQQQLRTALVEFGKAAASRGDDVNGLIKAGNSLSQALQPALLAVNSVNPSLNQAIIKDEAFNASFSQAPLDQLVANNNAVLQQFAANSDHLQSLLTHADSSLSQLDVALTGQGGSIRSFLDSVNGAVDRLNRFNDLIGLFGANLTGKEAGSTDVTKGLIAAIENPKSAFAGYNPCTPGVDSDCPSRGPMAGQKHYLEVTAFQEANPASNQPGASLFPCTIFGAPTNIPGCNGSVGAKGGASSGAPGRATLVSGADLSGFADFLGP
ncbi:MAG: MCE family protein [Chloroflexi bacterium]|nr:MAG: MCE family protein [Chloroflexota bacterium]